MSKAAAHIIFPDELDTMEPIEVTDGLTNAKAAFVGRYAINQIPERWRKIGLCGIYVLLSDMRGEEGTFDVYVGYTKTGFERRLFSHDADKPYWSQAILFANLDGPSWSSTQAQWLEGDIVRLLKQGRHVHVHNVRYTGDETLPEYELPKVEQMSLFIMRVLFLRGYRSASLGGEVKKLENSVREQAIDIAQQVPQKTATAPVAHAEIMEQKPARVQYVKTSSKPEVDIVYGNLWESLRKWRWRVKEEAQLYKAYHVFTDAELSAVMTARPGSVEELRGIPGCTRSKIDRFGESLIATLTFFYESEVNEPEPIIIEEKQKRWWGR